MAPAPSPPPPPLGFGARFFAAVLARRWLALYALVLPPAGWFAAQVGQDNSIGWSCRPTPRRRRTATLPRSSAAASTRC